MHIYPTQSPCLEELAYRIYFVTWNERNANTWNMVENFMIYFNNERHS